MIRAALAAAAGLLSAAAPAQVVRQPLDASAFVTRDEAATKAEVAAVAARVAVSSVNGQTGVVSVPVYTDEMAQTAARAVSAVLPGVYTIATLPACDGTTNAARYAYVSDLGGGADMVVCAGGFWKHIRLGTPQTNPATSSFSITPLATAPIQILSGNILSAMTLTVNPAGLYPGYMLYVRRPGILNVGASLGVKLAGGATFPVLGQTTAIFVYDGTQLVQVQ